jgi:hypothetical protein
MVFYLKNKDLEEIFQEEEAAFKRALFFESIGIEVTISQDSTPISVATALGMSPEKIEILQNILQDEIDDHH